MLTGPWRYCRLAFDTTFARHLSLLEGREEFYEKSPTYKGKGKGAISSVDATAPKSFPLLASACPGWICYAEKTHGELLPYISTVKSPQQVMGSLIKEWLAPKLNLRREDIYHVSVMPCYDKKLEASRPDFATADGNRDVDCVLTTGEVQKILDEKAVNLADYGEDPLDEAESFLPSLLSSPGSASGGYLHNAILAAIQAQPEASLSQLSLEVKPIRGEDYVEYNLRMGTAVVFRGAKCYGFRNLQNVVRKVGRETGVSVSKGAVGKAVAAKRGGMMKRGLGRGGKGNSENGGGDESERGFDFIEVMACPSGCVNGGGQISPPKHPLPVEVDREGMPIVPDTETQDEFKIVADVKDGHKLLSGKEWVQRVEEFYWRLGAKKIVTDGQDAPTLASVHDSVRPLLQPLVVEASYTALAEDIMGEMTAHAIVPEEVRRRILRTSYRAVESEEVNGLAVKW